jgi:protocatechuate 3,4-dioxygenase, beta subunit
VSRKRAASITSARPSTAARTNDRKLPCKGGSAIVARVWSRRARVSSRFRKILQPVRLLCVHKRMASVYPAVFDMPRPAAQLLRRSLLKGGAAAILVPAWMPTVHAAQTLMLTPAQTEGPFYPQASFFATRKDIDADLLQVAGSAASPKGTPLTLAGQVMRADGTPVGGALVEIWQCDATGQYLYTDRTLRSGDPGFQGFGRAITGGAGQYAFKTIRPVAYPGRPPHIHVKVAIELAGRRKDLLTTQLYFQGDDLSDDFVIRTAPGAQRDALITQAVPAGNELTARWKIVVAA